MNHMIRLSISAPTAHATTLAPLAQEITAAIGIIVKARGIDALMDINMNAVNPKSFARNWEKRQREIAEEAQ